MKKLSYVASALVALLVGANVPADAHNYVPSCCSDTCDWSFCDGKITAKADWLYWQAQQTNMSSAFSDVEGIDEVGDSVHYTDFNPNYTSGYRVALGYEVPSNGWEIKVAYSYLPSHTSTSLSPAEGIVVAPALNNFADFEFPDFYDEDLPFTSFHGNWDLTLNMVDVDVGKTLTFGECFRLHPHVGFRALWLDEKYRTEAFSSPDAETDFVSVSGNYKETFNGYGVEAGLGAAWNIGCGFSLVGHFGGSLLYSDIKSTVDNAALLFSDEDAESILIAAETRHAKYHIGTPTFDYFLGLAYVSTFCDTELDIYVGWEQHAFLDVNQLRLDPAYDHSGNLYTQGLTLGVRAVF